MREIAQEISKMLPETPFSHFPFLLYPLCNGNMKEDDMSNFEILYESMISELSRTLVMFDLTSSEARIFAVLYMERKPMTLDELSQAVGKSKTSMSTGVRILLDRNLVERVWRKGIRKNLYQADYQCLKKFLKSYIHQLVDETNDRKEALEEIKEQLSKETMQEREKEKLHIYITEMISFHNLLEEIFHKIHPHIRSL